MAVGEAAREARIAVNYSLSGESIDWAVPVVYARDPNTRLCPASRMDPRNAPSPSVGVATRRSTAQHAIRVAVWDMHSQFPQLRKTLDEMNQVQTYYGFEVVDLSVPMDAWYSYKGVRYLDGDRFADRLAPQIPQLGVGYLVAIADEPMAYDTTTNKVTLNAYGWWPSADKPPVLIFSTSGLGLQPSGPATDKAIANLTVSGIEGYVMDIDSHSRGPVSCPNYYNPDRKLEVLTGAQRFCKVCAERLKKKVPSDQYEAFNALLSAFD
jgi:hypothetical protein